MEDLVVDLIRRPFSSRNSMEQKTIVASRPTPELPNIVKTKSRSFQKSWYERKPWLTASYSSNALFCWPCLLFRPKHSYTWTQKGYKDMKYFLTDCKKHERSKGHMDAFKAWKTFSATESIDQQLSRARREEILRHNEEVRQNREMLKTLTEAVLYLGKQELPFRGNDESSDSLNKGNYRELLELMAKFDSVFERRLHRRIDPILGGGAGNFTGVSPDIQNDLIKAIDDVIEDHIDQEVASCSFISVQVDETTDISTKEQASIIIRLDSGSQIVERFLKFVNVSGDRTAAAISAVVIDALSHYNKDIGPSIQNKLVMQTYDGASVMSGHLNGVQVLVRREYPHAHFTHCAAHRLNLVLCQSVSLIPMVKVFFANVSAFSSFAAASPRRKQHLSTHNVDIPRPGETRWHYRSRTVSILYTKYEEVTNAFNIILEEACSWDDVSVNEANGLVQYLNSYLFCFLLCVFYPILEQAQILFAHLQNKETDFSFGARKIKVFQNFLSTQRTDETFFEKMRETESKVGPPSSRSDRKINFKQLYFSILDNIMVMVRERFSDIAQFAFLDLVNPCVFTTWKGKIPDERLKQLGEKYGSLFDLAALKSQLTFMYGDKDFHKENPMEILNYIYKYGLVDIYPEVVKLLKINGIISLSSASVERSFSCLKRVKSYLRSTMGQERLSSLCRISIHKDILKEKEDAKVLHDLVLQKFVERPRRLEFRFQ